MEATEQGFSWNRGGKNINVPRDDLPEVLKSLSADSWLNVVLGCLLARGPAIAEGERIASTIAEWFNTLLPVYQGERPGEGALQQG